MSAPFLSEAWPVGKLIMGLAAFIIVSGWLSTLVVSVIRAKTLLTAKEQAASEQRDRSKSNPSFYHAPQYRGDQSVVIETMTMDGFHYVPHN